MIFFHEIYKNIRENASTSSFYIQVILQLDIFRNLHTRKILSTLVFKNNSKWYKAAKLQDSKPK